MNRKVVPWTFLVGASLCMVLLVTDAVRAARPGARMANLRGHWDGFFLGSDGPVGHVQSEFAQPSARRISGDGRLLDAASGARLSSFNFAGTLADDVITATGRTPTGRFALHSGVQLFAGKAGDAGIMDAQFQFIPKRGQATEVGALLLRPFPDGHALNIAGESLGVCQSRIDPTFRADMTLELLSSGRNAFPGSIRCVPSGGSVAPFLWDCRATVSDDGRMIMIAQGKAGRMVVDGSIQWGAASTSSLGVGEKAVSRAVNSAYMLQFLDGRTDYGFYNFSLAPTLR